MTYVELWSVRKNWTNQSGLSENESYKRFLDRLYIPTRVLRYRGTGSPIHMAMYHGRDVRFVIKWAPILSARKKWKIANSFSPGHYR